VVPLSVCALLGAGEPDSAGVNETGRVPRVCITIFWSRVCRVLRRDRSSGDLSVLSI
jgi:hypothetical protein